MTIAFAVGTFFGMLIACILFIESEKFALSLIQRKLWELQWKVNQNIDGDVIKVREAYIKHKRFIRKAWELLNNEQY